MLWVWKKKSVRMGLFRVILGKITPYGCILGENEKVVIGYRESALHTRCIMSWSCCSYIGGGGKIFFFPLLPTKTKCVQNSLFCILSQSTLNGGVLPEKILKSMIEICG